MPMVCANASHCYGNSRFLKSNRYAGYSSVSAGNPIYWVQEAELYTAMCVQHFDNMFLIVCIPVNPG